MSGSRIEQPVEVLTPPVVAVPILGYEQSLANDARWALSEGSRFFEGRGAVQNALRKVTQRLDELGIPYAVAGGMALFRHGFRRFTEDVDVLVERAGLKTIHDQLEGRGYRPVFTGSKNLRDTEFGVRIEFLVTGDYPGDGKAKPVSFPNPANVSIELEGIKYLSLDALIELKIASGMTNPDRIKDLADVQELIKVLGLSADLGNRLNPFVLEKYRELWAAARSTTKRYMRIWRNKFQTLDARSLDEMIAMLDDAVGTLKAMRADGVHLDPNGGTADDYAYLVTTDPDVAKKYDMHDESEFWQSDERADHESDRTDE